MIAVYPTRRISRHARSIHAGLVRRPLPEPPRPVVTAMLLCDVVIRDARTHKTSVIGITHSATVDRFAPDRDPLVVYISLTDGRGDYTVRIELMRLEDLKTGGVVAEAHVRLHDRNSVGELVMDLPAIPVDRPGHYALQLHTDAAIIGSVSFTVVQSPDGEGADVGA